MPEAGDKTNELSSLLPSTSSVLPKNTAGWWKVLCSGGGILTDAYDLFVIDLVLHIINSLHPMSIWAQSGIVAAASAGAVIGQVGFGLLGDYFGRQKISCVTCALLIVGALLSASINPEYPHLLAAARFFLGIGIGGEYPLAATIAAESQIETSDAMTRTALVFSMQGFGMLLSCVVVLVPLYFQVSLQIVWRLALGLGAVLPALMLHQRLHMQETNAFEEVRERGGGDANPRTEDYVAQLRNSLHEHRWQLVGTGGSWFLLDVTFYAVGSFKARVSVVLFDWESDNVRDELTSAALFATMATMVAIPGYLLSVAYLSRIGWARLQTCGFFVLAALFALLGIGTWDSSSLGWRPSLLGTIFALLFLAFNFGPNTTTFVAPIDVYPAHIRASAHGISAAAGKVGAIVGTTLFRPVEDAYGLSSVSAAAAVICLLGVGTTWLASSKKEDFATTG